MNYEEWGLIKVNDRVENVFGEKGIVISVVGVGYIVKFDNGKTERIQNGGIKVLRKEKTHEKG